MLYRFLFTTSLIIRNEINNNTKFVDRKTYLVWMLLSFDCVCWASYFPESRLLDAWHSMMEDWSRMLPRMDEVDDNRDDDYYDDVVDDSRNDAVEVASCCVPRV